MKTLLLTLTFLLVTCSAAFAGENKDALEAPSQLAKNKSRPTFMTVAEGTLLAGSVTGVATMAEFEREFGFLRYEASQKKVIQLSEVRIAQLKSSIQSVGGPKTAAGSLMVLRLETEKKNFSNASIYLAASKRNSAPLKKIGAVSAGVALLTFSDLALKLNYNSTGKDVGQFAIDDFFHDVAAVVTDQGAAKKLPATRGLAEGKRSSPVSEELTVK